MNILMVHNYYRKFGGEDQSFWAEKELLRSQGHFVVEYTRDNHSIQESGIVQKLKLTRNTLWASDSFEDVLKILKSKKFDLVHCQNTFPLISPSVYSACSQEGIPVVQSLRNYRLLCPNSLFYRNSQPCESCLGKFIPWPGALFACYRESHFQTAVVAGMLSFHRSIRTWHKRVDMYIALSEFSRNKFIQGGLPSERIKVKPNFVVDHGMYSENSKQVVFVSRFSHEKGVFTLLNAWKNLKAIPLVMVGTGPLLDMIKSLVEKEGLELIKLLGFLSNRETIAVIKRSQFLVFPTEWYEPFGRVIVEAYSAGIPVVASRIGAVSELVDDGKTGLLFTAGNSSDLADKVSWLWNHPEETIRMGENARRKYEEKYAPERNYKMLIDIYQQVIDSKK